MPSKTKGIRINPLVAPHIFMMAISSCRDRVASLMVLDTINSEITNSTATMPMVTRVTTLRTVMKPLATSMAAE